MRTALTMVLAAALALGACAKKEDAAKAAAAKAEAAKVEAAKAEAPKEPPKPPSEFAALRKQMQEFALLATACSKGWFTKVDPAKIDKWELPIDIPSMEDKCDPLLQQFESMVEPAAGRHPVLDAWLRNAALVTDRYMFLAFRCKKVGVRDKVPYKKMLTELRDALVADVGAMAEGLQPALLLTDKDLRDGGDLANEPRMLWLHGAVDRLGGDFATWIAEPRKAQAPIWRYSLMTTVRIGGLAARSLGSPRLAVDAAAVEAAKGLSDAFAGAWSFWKGDYFEAEEAQSPAIQKAFKKAEVAWKKASAKAWPDAAKAK
jgi:hypothetical protein